MVTLISGLLVRRYATRVPGFVANQRRQVTDG
jgi:hypothetical protein